MATSTRFAPEPPFVAHVYADDYLEIRKLVQQYPEIETGGDLFGLWQDDETVVIQLFIGPGKNCERTTTSFYQDIDYLRRVGSVITNEEGLCNVGEWHSHHQIGMPEPSAADRRTVFNNMPQLGLERFVLFIATIGSTRSGRQQNKRTRDVKLEQINLHCFLFLGSTHEIVNGGIKIIEGSNPHRIRKKALREIEDGAEIPKDPPHRRNVESPPQPPRNKKPDKKKQQAERFGANKLERQAKEVPPPPAVLRETKPRNVEENDTSTHLVSRETKLRGTPPESPPGEKPQDNQRHGRVQDLNADKDRSKDTRGYTNENQPPIPLYYQQQQQQHHQQQQQQQQQGTDQAAQYSSRAARAAPSDLTRMTGKGFF